MEVHPHLEFVFCWLGHRRSIRDHLEISTFIDFFDVCVPFQKSWTWFCQYLAFPSPQFSFEKKSESYLFSSSRPRFSACPSTCKPVGTLLMLILVTVIAGVIFWEDLWIPCWNSRVKTCAFTREGCTYISWYLSSHKTRCRSPQNEIEIAKQNKLGFIPVSR